MRGDRPAELVVGSVQLGLAYGAANRTGMPAREAALKLVKRASEAGVLAFDTARAYGEAEERLGAALNGRKCFTATKLSPLPQLSEGASRDEVREAVDESVSQSLTALDRKALDCLMLHRASHLTEFGGAVWERLKELKDEGTIAMLGVSVQSPKEAREALADHQVRHLQLPFNILDWRWRGAGVIAAIAKRKDVTVHARSVFLQGLFAAGDPSIWPKIDGVDGRAVLDWLSVQAKELGRLNAADLCLAYVRGQNWIDGVVVGMENEDQLDSNLHLMSRPPLRPEDCARIEAARPRLPAELLDPAKWPRR
jgi:aryl-alcohol dehydrogenase-like predicted oxidoreductase